MCPSVMPPTIVIPDISTAVSKDGQLSIDFLLPNGILLPLYVDFYKPLELLKDVIWKEAKRHPLYDKMKRLDHYIFVCINQLGQKEEILDECQCLSDIRPLGAFLQLKEKKDNNIIQKQMAEEKINKLIGRGMHDIDAVHSIEIADFRKQMLTFCEDIMKQRQRQGWMEKFMYKHPPRIRNTAELPDSVREKSDSNIMLSIILDEHGRTNKLKCSLDLSPDDLMEMVLNKQKTSGNIMDVPDKYILKVIGIEDYLYGCYPLQQFKYIYMCLLRKTVPELKLLLKKTVMEAPPPVPPLPASMPQHSDIPNPKRLSGIKKNIVWDLEDKFDLTIKTVERINVCNENRVKLVVGLFHGSEAISKKRTEELTISEDGFCQFNTNLKFDIDVKDLPLMSKLCFTLCTRKGTRDFNPIAWANIPVFDFRSRLIFGERDLPMWAMADNVQLEDECYPIGTVSPNPLGKNTTAIKVVFPEYKMPVSYPTWDIITECAAQNMEHSSQPGSPQWRPSKSHLEQMRMLIDQEDMLGLLCEQDKELMWMMRYECRELYPYALPKLLSSVTWSNHIDVAKMLVLLDTWPNLPVERALELLDFNYPDKRVNKYAVSCLENLKDDDLSHYLLQLVQALKYESHLSSPLVEFLLKKALKNRHIGHQFFWLLRSEMHSPFVTVRFGLILEVYLKSHPDHLNLLVKQNEALNKLNAVNMLVKTDPMKNDFLNKDMKKALHAVLDQSSYREVLSDLYSPLTPLFKLKKLEIEKCKCMDSKKRPLWLVWSNADPNGDDVRIIFKSGDDLRQDMLTLQILQLMDSIWKSEGLDLRMNAYGCIATGHERGVIEVVTESETIANIQLTLKLSPWDQSALYAWLGLKNPTTDGLNNAVDEFTLSCAGYTVATYVLGIGDRHNDNIMLKCTGQIFHIDFGHFLGRFKTKFGFRRERVPFVMTKHFLYVITKGDTMPSNRNKFRECCERAYLLLRRHGTLLIRLFMMMLSSGIPQLTSVSDVDYLKERLALHVSEDEARSKFIKTYKNAENSPYTTLNWWCHLVAKK